MTTNERIREAGWYAGTEKTWQKLSIAEREDLAFRATGCEMAYPTWEVPVDCVHTDCRIRRGELEPIEKTKGILQYERETGWLRFMEESEYRKLYDVFIEKANKTGEYDPWKLSWQGIVFSGILA